MGKVLILFLVFGGKMTYFCPFSFVVKLLLIDNLPFLKSISFQFKDCASPNLRPQ